MPVKSPARVTSLSKAAFVPRFTHGDMAEVSEVTGVADGTRLGSGFVRMSQAEIPWRTRYDEVILVLEGELIVRTPGGDLVARAMECIWLPKGSDLTYVAESALVFYAIEPAGWAEGNEEDTP